MMRRVREYLPLAVTVVATCVAAVVAGRPRRR